MNFDFSDDQKLLRDQLRRFLADKLSSAATRQLMDGKGALDGGFYARLGELGVLGAAIPEQYGGAGLGHLELCLGAEELGRALAPLPVASSIYLAAEFVMRAGSDDQKRRWLPRLAQGTGVGTFAFAEAAGRTTPERIAATVADGRLSGGKTPVAAGAWADVAIVAARGGEAGSLSLHLVELDRPGVRRLPVRTIDPSLGFAMLAFDDAVAEPLGGPGEGLAIIEQVHDRAAVLIAFEQLGGADRALAAACDHARERFAFGRPIGSFQAIKHQLADLYVAATLARSNCYYAAWALATDAADLPEAAAIARVAATRAYQACAKGNIQLHGGMGFTWEADCHLHYRRSNALALMLGPLSAWEDRIVDCLRADASAAA